METDEQIARNLQLQEWGQHIPNFGRVRTQTMHRESPLRRLITPEGQNILNLVPSAILAQGGRITMTNEQGGVITITVTGTSLPRTELPSALPVKINLDKEKYAAMIKDVKFNGNSADSSCAICQEDFKKKENLKITPCDHIFHPKCISTWLEKECTRPTCPSCRHDCREELDNDSKPR